MKLNIEDEEKREDYKGESKQRPYNAFDERKRRPVREGRGRHLASLSSYVDVERRLRCCVESSVLHPLCSAASSSVNGGGERCGHIMPLLVPVAAGIPCSMELQDGRGDEVDAVGSC